MEVTDEHGTKLCYRYFVIYLPSNIDSQYFHTELTFFKAIGKIVEPVGPEMLTLFFTCSHSNHQPFLCNQPYQLFKVAVKIPT